MYMFVLYFSIECAFAAAAKAATASVTITKMLSNKKYDIAQPTGMLDFIFNIYEKSLPNKRNYIEWSMV